MIVFSILCCVFFNSQSDIKLQMGAHLLEKAVKKEKGEQFNEFQEQDHINVTFPQNSK